MNICFFISTLSKGGAERVIANLSNYLINDNIENSIDIITMFNTEVAYELDKNINVISLDKKYVEYRSLLNNNKGIKKIIFYVKKYFKNIVRKKELKNILKEKKYDVIIAFLPEPSYMLLSLKKYLKNIPIIISDRNDPNIEYSNFRKKYLMKKLYPKATGFVFQTPDARKYFKFIKDIKSEIIPNPVNDKMISESYVGEREKIIVNIGRLEEQKNQIMLIKSFQNLKEKNEKYKDYKLIIYGEGTLRESLQKYINENNLEDYVFLAGQVEDIKDKIYKASLFVLSSYYEGMPNALIEAMCLGVPSISTDCPCGGPKFLIQNNVNGILVKNNDIKEMEQAIDKVLSNTDLSIELGENASKLVDIVSSKIINKKWMEFIIETIKDSKKG